MRLEKSGRQTGWLRRLGGAFVVLSLGLADPTLSQTAAQTPSDASPVAVYVFWKIGCPYCEDAKAFLSGAAQSDPSIVFHALEISTGSANRVLFQKALVAFDVERAAVPLTIVGNEAFLGYGGDDWTGAEIVDAIDACRRAGCADHVKPLMREGVVGLEGATTASPVIGGGSETRAPPERLSLPLIGEISTAGWSLPVLTVALAAVDGFNPCAMWVLVFLIGLLLGMNDRIKMWTIGVVFLLTSGVVYLAFMTAWLNVALLVGAVVWLRLVIGLLAMGGGAYYLREFVVNPGGVCRVSDLEQRQRWRERFRSIVAEKRFLATILGVVLLAAGVNLVELLCSAGIPAIFAQVLSMSDLSSWGYAAFMGLYIAVFLLDDFIVFTVAMIGLQALSASAAISRAAHLVGGVVLFAIGVLLIVKPGWLAMA